MKKLLFSTLASLMLFGVAHAEDQENPVVELQTSLGNIRVELFADKAPISTKNFLQYVKEDFYNGTTFHRIIKDFMIQGGGFKPGMTQKKTHDPIKNEAGNGLANKKYTIAMARTRDPDSATSQFFINTADNPFLDRENAADKVGYAVFGRVIKGKDVVDKIAGARTRDFGSFQNVPVEDILIKKAVLVTEDGDKSKNQPRK